ncbi:Protein msta, isoform A [Orchesella cincta]|uniref:Protein msta, isoform A n=1 Tax=Orchesella cincta TaxID=48709 RepID=A0A1D2N049_ORCCI|nr:Protein msta, isoform A [Orchesella cincta]
MGRYVVASRDIPAGTIVMDEEALVIGPKQDTLPICLGCHKSVDGTYFCSHCYFPLCNEDCEKNPIHADNECLIFRKKRAFPKQIEFDRHHPVYESILAIRCLRLKELNPKKWKRLITMEHHNNLRKELEGLWNRNEVNVVQFLKNMFKIEEDPMEIHTVVGYGDINAFEIRQSGVSICGMFPDVALMAHECISNTHHSITDDNRMIVRTTIPLKKGEMITTTYTHTLDGTLERRRHVRESKLFDCCCPRCKSPDEMGTFFSAIKCKTCTDGYQLPAEPLDYNPVWNCNTCDYSLPNKTVDYIVEGIREEIQEAEQVQSCVELLEGVIQKHSGKTVHPNHFTMIAILHTLSQFYGRVKGWGMPDLSYDALKRKEEICRKLLEVVDVLEPGLSRIRGSSMFELQQAIYFRIQKEFEDGLISVDDLRRSLEEVLELLKSANEILSFDSPSSPSGKTAKVIPDSMIVVKTVLKKVCNIDIS